MPSIFGISFFAQGPSINIQTSNKDLQGISVDLRISCRSTLSTVNSGSPSFDTNDFTVTFRDECLDTTISPPAYRDPYSVPLYTNDAKGITRAPGQTLVCAEPYNRLILVGTSGVVTPATFTFNPLTDVISVQPVDRNNVGSYGFKFETCVDVPLNSGTTVSRCAQSETFNVVITDPCLGTSI